MKDKIVWVHSGMSDSHKDTVVNSGNIEFPPSSHYPSSIVDWFCSLDRDTEQFPDPQDLAQYGPALMERGYYHLDQLLHGITQRRLRNYFGPLGSSVTIGSPIVPINPQMPDLGSAYKLAPQ